jgi:hypothetical protein
LAARCEVENFRRARWFDNVSAKFTHDAYRLVAELRIRCEFTF